MKLADDEVKRATLAAMASSKKFQGPRGTRDFYPADMAVRRYIESVWRTTSINHGFDEVEGPTFEHLELYTHKSGPGIVSELFSFKRAGGETEYALRPEFTPTLARMVAARAAELPKPIKWFAIPGHYRAERPQRGRLREFFQWNVDVVGGDRTPDADKEVIATAVSALEKLGLGPAEVKVRIGDREVVTSLLSSVGCADEFHTEALSLLDKKDKIPQDQFQHAAQTLHLDYPLLIEHANAVQRMASQCLGTRTDPAPAMHFRQNEVHLPMEWIDSLARALTDSNVHDWCVFDFSIARGLAYYTGTVFEVIADGERAVAGGGRYDKLIESFGGPSMPACGFGMGDVVLGLLLHDKGLLPDEVYLAPLRPHVFVISNGAEQPEAELPRLIAQLRKAGCHVRHTYRATRNVGKLLGEADKLRSRTAIILGDELMEGRVVLKDLEGGEQREVALDDLERALREVLDAQENAGV